MIQGDKILQENLSETYRSALAQFRKVTRSYVIFNLSFLFLFAAELILSPFLFNQPIFALELGALFLTVFCYCVLLFYFQTRKPDQLVELKNRFIDSCRAALPDRLSVAEALATLSTYLNHFSSSSRFSSYCYSEDVFKMKVLLTRASIDEHLMQIHETPTDLAVHASLANTYAALSKIYRAVSKGSFETKARNAAQLALEEYRILSHFAPNDPWAHEQLAAGYRDLDMLEEEVHEVETLLKLKPLDKEVLYRLGSLYFKQGLNAKGLQIYKELKKLNFQKAGDLLSSYGSFPL